MLMVSLLLIVLLNACTVNNVIDVVTEEEPELSLEYQPPFVPVTFVLDETGINIETGVSMITPLGRFGLGMDYPVAEFGKVTLVLKDQTKGEVEVFHVVVEDNVQILLEGRAQISIGRAGIITIDITEGTLHTIMFTNEAPMMAQSTAGGNPGPITVQMDEHGEVLLNQ